MRLSPVERLHIERAEQMLLLAKRSEDFYVVRKGVEDLNQATMRLAELMMDDAVSTALKGKTMDQAAQAQAGGEAPVAGHAFAKADFETSSGAKASEPSTADSVSPERR